MKMHPLPTLVAVALLAASVTSVGCTAAIGSAASAKPLALSGYRTKAAAAAAARTILASVREEEIMD